MNLDTITTVHHPRVIDEVTEWSPHHAWLAGGTWLFSEPQRQLRTLVDLDGLCWPALTITADGLEIASTCSLAELCEADLPADWIAAPMIRECCDCLLASFKIWNTATVGGNLCMSLPAGAMISLVAALEGWLELWPRKGAPRQVPSLAFVTGNHTNVLGPGELLRSIHLPESALKKRFALRQGALTKLGRSAALIIGTSAPAAGDLLLTITAATPRPVQIVFSTMPQATELRDAIEAAVSDDGWFEDVHGKAEYKRHLTFYFAEQIRRELLARGPA